MGWPAGKPRSFVEKQAISNGLKKRYRRKTRFLHIKDLSDYDGFYQYDHKMLSIKKKLTNHSFGKYILQYIRYLSLTCKSGHLYKSACILNNELSCVKSLSQKSILKWYYEIQSRPLSNYTKACRINTVKSFLRWKNKGLPLPYFYLMKTTKIRMRPQRNFTLSEVKAFLRCTESFEELAFFALLWEGGFSVGELLKLRICDVSFRDDCVELYVESKDRNRITPILKIKGPMFPLGSYKLLKRHLQDVKSDMVWSFRRYNQVQYRVKKIRNLTGLYHVRSHSFRKSRATYNIEIGFGLADTAVYGGWRIGSTVLKEYIIRSGRGIVPKMKAFNESIDFNSSISTIVPQQ